MPQYVALLRQGEQRVMPKMVTGERLRQAVTEATFIKEGDPNSVEGLKYDFHLGDSVLKAKFHAPQLIEKIDHEDRIVEPGEAVFVLTRERLDLPGNMIATLTPKRKLAHDGILILGGLAVDPLYRGHLLIGLYNISSTPFVLRPGRKLIGAVFYELALDEAVANMTPPPEITDFPDDLVKLIRDYEPVGVQALQEEITSTKRELQALKADLISDKEWRETFKTAIDKHTKAVEDHDRQLGDVLRGLDKEQEARAAADKKIEDRLGGMSNMFFGARLIWLAFLAVLLIVVGAILSPLVPKLLTGLAQATGPAATPPAAATAPPSR